MARRGYAATNWDDQKDMINVSPTSNRPPLPPPAARSTPDTEPPSLKARLFPYLLLTVAALLISSCTA